MTRYLGALEKARVIDAALKLAGVVEKAVQNAGGDEADTMLANMVEIMRSLKDSLQEPEYMTAESARQFAARMDGMIRQFDDRMSGQRARKAVDNAQDVEEETDAEEGDQEEAAEDSDLPNPVQATIRRRLRGEASEDDVMKAVFKIVGKKVKP